jgi:hypothetical protein
MARNGKYANFYNQQMLVAAEDTVLPMQDIPQ